MYRTLLFFIILYFLYPLLVCAQDDPVRTYAEPGYAKRWSLGISFGPDFYVGDLTQNTLRFNKNTSLAGSLFTQYQFTNVIGLRIQLNGGWLNGHGNIVVNGQQVERTMTGIIADGTVNGVINFSNMLSPFRASRKFFVYGTLGIGYSAWYTKVLGIVYNADSISTNNPLNNFHHALLIPVGLGITYKVIDRLNLSLEWNFRFINSDLLDQTSGGAKWDMYDCLGVGISFNFGKPRSKSLKVKDYPMPAYEYKAPEQLPPPPVMPLNVINPPPPKVTLPATQSDKYTYVVQIFAFDHHQYSAAWIKKRYKVPYEVRMEKEGKMERFLVGNYQDMNQATKICKQMKKLGIRDAFVVAYQDGVRHHTVTP